MDKTDPYVQVTISGQKKKTSTKNNAGSNARWGESLTFSGVTATSGVLEVFDSDTIRDDLLGGASFNLVPGDQWVTISGPKGRTGDIALRVTRS